MLGAVVYLISPIDLIPDVLVGPGVLDDAIVVPGMLMLALKAIVEAGRKAKLTPAVRRRDA